VHPRLRFERGQLTFGYSVVSVVYEISNIVLLEIVAFWKLVPQSLVDIDQQFRGTFCLHLQRSDFDTPKYHFDLVENTMFREAGQFIFQNINCYRTSRLHENFNFILYMSIVISS
jgi:hypothetical protein